MNAVRPTVALLLVVLLLLGCGQKGRLYIPAENDRPPASAN